MGNFNRKDRSEHALLQQTRPDVLSRNHGGSMSESPQEWLLKRRDEDLGVTCGCVEIFIEELLIQSHPDVRPSIRSVVPALLVQWGGWSNCAAMLAMAVLWLY